MEPKKTLSVFVDESGRFLYPDGDSRFYIVGMVFHDQSVDISSAVRDFDRSIYSLGLDPDAFVFHAGPLVRREKGYEFFSRNHRGKIYNRMMTFARRIGLRKASTSSLAAQVHSGGRKPNFWRLMHFHDPSRQSAACLVPFVIKETEDLDFLF